MITPLTDKQADCGALRKTRDRRVRCRSRHDHVHPAVDLTTLALASMATVAVTAVAAVTVVAVHPRPRIVR
jgi:hypothetical protein